jgi:glycosyltransferase involved in cell wall biosynthesis
MVINGLVSVNIPIYNGKRFLAKTIQSVLDQTYQNIEIVLLIDGTHDESEKIIVEFQKKYPDKIRYKWQENQGLARTRNELIKMSKGEFIAILDQDDLWRTDKLEKQMALFAKDPEIGVVFSGFTDIDVQGNILRNYTGAMHRGYIFNELVRKYFIPCPSIVFKKEIINKIGLFDLVYKYSEEADFLFKAALFFKFDFVEEPLCSYRHHDKNTSKNDTLLNYEVYLLRKNILRFARSNGITLSNKNIIRWQIYKRFMIMLRYKFVNVCKTIVHIRTNEGR